MLKRCVAGLAAAIACCLALPSRAWMPAPDVIVSRADADASGGWPVALWVVDGQRSFFTVRTSRERLGRLAWRPANAQALMQLERFGAPELTTQPEPNPCPVDLGWGDLAALPDAHPLDEQEAPGHPACAAGACKSVAWRAPVPTGEAGTLPLARLMPDLAARRPEWLVLYVVSPADSVTLQQVAALNPDDALRGPRSQIEWSQLRLPGDAAARFPAIHQALLEQAAVDQGLAQASVLMRNDVLSPVHSLGNRDGWSTDFDGQRPALGLDAAHLRNHVVTRLLMRLVPADRPATLQLQTGAPFGSMLRLKALEQRPETLASCRSRLAALDCNQVCSSMTTTGAAQSKPGSRRLRACAQSCQAMTNPPDAVIQQRLDDLAERQSQAWRWVAQMTGQPVSRWQTR